MRFKKYSPNQYINLVENGQNQGLQNYIQKERKFISSFLDPDRDYVDLGAGYGRVLPDISARQVVAIEIDSKMYKELEKRAKSFRGVLAIEGDILNLHELLANLKLNKPVFLLLQNTLGTIEGSWKEVLKVTLDEAQKRSGEVVISFFRQPALRSWGISMYAEIKDMVGEVDSKKIDTDKGLFVSKTGYVSKWWTDQEIAEFKKLGKVEDEVIEPEFHILRLSF